jgi:hypothetical protein
MGISAQKAQAFKDYVSKIPDGDRQQFVKTYQNLSPAGQAEAVGRAVGFDNNNSTASNVGNAAILGGGAAVVGSAAKWMADPFVKRAILQTTQINPLKQKYNINPNIQTGNIPDEIGKQINLASNNNKISSTQFKQSLINEESSVKSGLIKQTALNLSNNYPAWQQSGYKAYGDGLTNIEDSLAKANKTFQPDEFNQNVIQKTANTMAARGLSQEAENLTKYANNGTPTGAPMSFSDAKQAVTNLSSQNPMAAKELRANWGSHIEDTTQGTDVGDQMSAINDAYKPFKQADTVAYKFMGSNPNVLDTTKVTNSLHNYYLGNKQGNPETSTFLKSLGSGTGGTTPINGLNDQADAIDAAIQKRSGMVAVQKLTENNNLDAINTLKTDQASAGTLANIEDGLESQIKTRGVVAGAVAGLAGVGKMFLHSAPYGIVQNELLNRTMGFNPVQGIQAAITGATGNPQQKQDMMNQMQQAYQKSMQT